MDEREREKEKEREREKREREREIERMQVKLKKSSFLTFKMILIACLNEVPKLPVFQKKMQK